MRRPVLMPDLQRKWDSIKCPEGYISSDDARRYLYRAGVEVRSIKPWLNRRGVEKQYANGPGRLRKVFYLETSVLALIASIITLKPVR